MLSKTQKIEESDYGKYLLALGSFIDSYARLEFIIRRILEEQSGVQPNVLRALIGFPTISQVIEKIKALRQLKHNPPLSNEDMAEIDNAFTHLKLITKIRDRLIHQGANPVATGHLFIRSSPKSKTIPGDYSDNLFNPRALYDMSIDLQTIGNKLQYHFAMSKNDPFIDACHINARQPWRYKPQPPRTPSRVPRSRRK